MTCNLRVRTMMALVCGLTTLHGLEAALAEEPLIRLDSGFDIGKVKCTGGTGVRLAGPAGQEALRISAEQAGKCGIILPAPEGKWDLSKFNYVRMDVRNCGDKAVLVEARAPNPDASGLVNCAMDFLTVPSGQTVMLRVVLRRKKPDWAKVDLFGMRGYPWGPARSVSRPLERTLDAANVTCLSIEMPEAPAGQSIEISSIRVGGSYRQPTPLLAEGEKFFPFVDEYGQYIHADWPGKTHDDAELLKHRRQEDSDLQDHPGCRDWDAYGGWKSGPALKATGHFYITKHQDKWWLVDPEGRLFFSHGIDCVNTKGDTVVGRREHWFSRLPQDDSRFAAFVGKGRQIPSGYFKGETLQTYNFIQANMLRKYGGDWPEVFADLAHIRLRSWGLNTIGNWSEPTVYLRRRTPYTVDVRSGGKPLEGGPAKLFDVFDDRFRRQVRAEIAKKAGPTADDPWCIGYFVDNEIPWGGDDASLARYVLASPPDQPAKRVMAEELKARYGRIEDFNEAWGANLSCWDDLLKMTDAPDAGKARADMVAFSRRMADEYFRTIRAAISEYAPQKLYLGCRFAMARFSPVVLSAAAEHCHVLSFNIYRRTVEGLVLPVQADVPWIIGEFHFGALDRGLFDPGMITVEDQAERAAAYAYYVRSVLRHRQFVGCHWFQYTDQPMTGRLLDGESSQIGFVDIVDTPYGEIIAASREIARTMYACRLSGR